jgi:WD40 repeat protein
LLLPQSFNAAPTVSCRDGNDVFAVNSMSFHPQFGTFVTAGSDGAYNFWDKDSKQRLKAMQKCSQPIPCGDFNRRAGPQHADILALFPLLEL